MNLLNSLSFFFPPPDRVSERIFTSVDYISAALSYALLAGLASDDAAPFFAGGAIRSSGMDGWKPRNVERLEAVPGTIQTLSVSVSIISPQPELHHVPSLDSKQGRGAGDVLRKLNTGGKREKNATRQPPGSLYSRLRANRIQQLTVFDARPPLLAAGGPPVS